MVSLQTPIIVKGSVYKTFYDQYLERSVATVIVAARNRPVEDDLQHHFIATDLTTAKTGEFMKQVNEKFGGILINNIGGLKLVVADFKP